MKEEGKKITRKRLTKEERNIKKTLEAPVPEPKPILGVFKRKNQERERSINSILLLSSVDGKISINESCVFTNVLKGFPDLESGIRQFYDIEKEVSGKYTMTTGKAIKNWGINDSDKEAIYDGKTYIIIDNKPYLNENAIRYMSQLSNRVIFITTNKEHPAFKLRKKYKNIEMMKYDDVISFKDVFEILRDEKGIESVTIQAGGTINSILIKLGLIDYIYIVQVPIIVGGATTPSIVDGLAIQTEKDIMTLKTLELVDCKKLKNSYLFLTYKVKNGD